MGKIPATNIFAGRILKKPLEGGHLWRCRACHLFFKWPRLKKSERDALYALGVEYAWGSVPSERPDWQIARKWLHEVLPKGSRVLDLGCSDGGFLNYAGASFHCFGAEIHPNARQRARAKGINIIAEDFEHISYESEPLDCVTAFDVIEHHPQPRRFLEHCRDLVKPGGWIVISTGNADSPSFRFMGPGYWYCTIAEHMSFINLKWCYEVAAELRLLINKHIKFSHGNRDILHYPVELLKNALYRLVPSLSVQLRLRGYGKKDAKTHSELAGYPPSWMAAKDHFLMLFSRQ
ncbi:MAG: class I SAM-dependent methyltransferase [Desulfobacterales bacterium]